MISPFAKSVQNIGSLKFASLADATDIGKTIPPVLGEKLGMAVFTRMHRRQGVATERMRLQHGWIRQCGYTFG